MVDAEQAKRPTLKWSFDPFRYLLGFTAMGILVGVTWTLAMLHFVSQHRTAQIMYSVTGVLVVAQAISLYFDRRRLKSEQRVLKIQFEEIAKLNDETLRSLREIHKKVGL